ncbi:MAG TPA: nuclear transport factor 2 family protein, partial [Solirubrobacteraceae bacterium]|nr:nuclear transport factor 2 family protein [Solirubrobacteraceae bacterium]
MAHAQEHLEREPSDVLASWYDAWNAHDVDAVSALMVDDVRYEDPAAPEAAMVGRGAVEAYVSAAFRALPDLRLEKLEEWTTEG